MRILQNDHLLIAFLVLIHNKYTFYYFPHTTKLSYAFHFLYSTILRRFVGD